MAGARTIEESADLIAAAGFSIERVERCDDALGEMIDRIAARVRLARLLPASPVHAWLDQADTLRAAALAALADGVIGYGVLIARA